MKILNLMKLIFLPFDFGLALAREISIEMPGPKEMPAKVLAVNFSPTHLANSSTDWPTGQRRQSNVVAAVCE